MLIPAISRTPVITKRTDSSQLIGDCRRSASHCSLKADTFMEKNLYNKFIVNSLLYCTVYILSNPDVLFQVPRVLNSLYF